MHRSKLECLLPFWNDLDTFEKEQLLKGCFETTYRKGVLMNRSEQQCLGIMVILSGQLRTFIVSEEGREVTLFRVYQDDVCVLSGSCLMDAIVFDVMIDAVEDTNVIIIPSAIIAPLIEKYPKIEVYLYKTAAERFSDVIWTMQQILFLSTDKRVAILLWDEIARTNCMIISATHDEIARYIGSAREVVTKVLKYFVQEGIVTLSRGKITIINKDLLQKYL